MRHSPERLGRWTPAPVAPQSGVALLGEVAKYVTLSSKRFTKVEDTTGKLTATLTGVAGEDVEVCAVQVPSMKKSCKTVHFDQGGDQTVAFSA